MSLKNAEIRKILNLKLEDKINKNENKIVVGYVENGVVQKEIKYSKEYIIEKIEDIKRQFTKEIDISIIKLKKDSDIVIEKMNTEFMKEMFSVNR